MFDVFVFDALRVVLVAPEIKRREHFKIVVIFYIDKLGIIASVLGSAVGAPRSAL